MVICVDFDGTCVKHAFPFVGEDIGAQEVLRELVENGHQLVLFTMRSDIENPKSTNPEILALGGKYLTHAIEWFKKNDIPLYGIQENPTQKHWTHSPKCYAHLYIDDAALGIPLVYDRTRPYIDWVKTRDLLIIKGVL